MTTSEAGRLGEAKVFARLAELGWFPFVDPSGKCPVDMIAWKDGVFRSFQVKSTGYKAGTKNYVVQIGSTRSNRTQNVIHKFDCNSADYLAVYVAPEDKIYFIPCSTITAGRQISILPIHDNIIPQ